MPNNKQTTSESTSCNADCSPFSELTKMKRIHDTPRTDAVLNTFDGNQSKLAADLATHAEELERELTDMRRWKREAMIVLSKWEAVWVAAGSPGTDGQLKADATLKFILENSVVRSQK